MNHTITMLVPTLTSQKALVKDGNKFLLLKPIASKSYPGFWDIPGGKPFPGENLKTTAEREVFEETGVRIQALKPIAKYKIFSTEIPIPTEYTIFSVKILTKSFEDNIILSHEHMEYKWVDKEEILDLRLRPYVRKYFEEN